MHRIFVEPINGGYPNGELTADKRELADAPEGFFVPPVRRAGPTSDITPAAIEVQQFA